MIVREINPGWLWVSVRKAGQNFEGWVSAAEAVTLDEAIARASQAIHSNASDATAWLQRGRLYAAAGDRQKAIADLTEAIRLDASLVEAYLQRAEARLLENEAELSRDDCEAALRLNPQLGEAYRRRGDAYLAEGSLPQAHADYDRAIQLDPASPAAVNGRSVVWLHRGEVAKAIAESNRAIESDPSFVPAYLSRASGWLAKREIEKAVQDYRAALAFDPKNVVALHGLANTSHRQGNLDEAIKLYSRAIKIQPRYAIPYANRADCHYRKGDLGQALADYNEAIRLDAGLADAYLGRAAVLRELGAAAKAQLDLANAKFLDVTGSGSSGPATQKIAVPEADLASRLATALEKQDYVLLELAVPTFGPIHVRVQEYSFEDRFVRQQPGTMWSSTVFSPEVWQKVQEPLVRHADHLLDCKDWAAGEESGIREAGFLPPRWIALLYHKPRRYTLKINTNLQLVLSPEVQKHLTVAAVSTYPASRSVVIVGEPHWNLEQHWSLLQGLEVLFADNPSLLDGNRTVFLSEGLPSGEQLSVAPLVRADAKPSDRRIRYVLGSFLIPGYVAYEWKHQRGIPILGVEDSVLYGVSARAWLQLNSRRADHARYSSLLSYAVGARNCSVVETLENQLPHYNCPILFVGSGHLGDGWVELGLLSTPSISPNGTPSTADCGRFADLLETGQLERLKQAVSRGLLDLLRERKIGYYCLEARAEPFPNASVQQQLAQRYSKLLQAQLGANVDAYVREYVTGRTSVSVRPSIENAVAVLFAADGENDKDNDSTKKNNKTGGGNASSPAEGNASSLAKVLSGLPERLRLFLVRFLSRLPKGWKIEVLKPGRQYKVYDSNNPGNSFRIDMGHRGYPYPHLNDIRVNGNKLSENHIPLDDLGNLLKQF